MTEKRFWCLEEYAGETSPIVDGKFAPTNGWLCNKLNELNEENKKLKQENEQLKQLIKETLEITPIEHSLAVKLKNSIREMYE